MTTVETNTTDKSAAVAAQGAHAAPEKAPAKKAASQKQAALKAKKAANGAKQGAKAKAAPKTAAKSSAKASKKAAAPRAESKGAKILEMIARAKGATLGEIMKATNWQAHSVRGFISTAAKKHGGKIESAKNNAGERVYKIAK
jgi:hypothetical protein